MLILLSSNNQIKLAVQLIFMTNQLLEHEFSFYHNDYELGFHETNCACHCKQSFIAWIYFQTLTLGKTLFNQKLQSKFWPKTLQNCFEIFYYWGHLSEPNFNALIEQHGATIELLMFVLFCTILEYEKEKIRQKRGNLKENGNVECCHPLHC